MAIEVRLARPEDIPAIAALHRLSRERLARFIPPRPGSTFHDSLQAGEEDALFREQLADDDCLLAVAELDGRYCGFISATVQPYEDDLLHSPYLTIEFVEVEPGLSGQGVGTQLIQAAENFARLRGIRNVDLQVWQDNPRAQSLYGRLGYSPLEIRMYKLLD